MPQSQTTTAIGHAAYFLLLAVLEEAKFLHCTLMCFISIFRSGTDLISLHILFLFLLLFLLLLFFLGWPLQKSPGMKFGRVVLQVNTQLRNRLTESDFWHEIIISRWRRRRHLKQKSAAAWWVHTQCQPGACAASSASSWSITHL